MWHKLLYKQTNIYTQSNKVMGINVNTLNYLQILVIKYKLSGSPYGKHCTITVTSRLLFRIDTAYNKANPEKKW